MDEQASFEPQAVLVRHRPGWARLGVVVPLVALAATAWIGVRGRQPDAAQVAAQPSIPAAADAVARPVTGRAPGGPGATALPFPGRLLGLEVHTVADLDAATRSGEAELAVMGWYAPRASLACPEPSAGGQVGPGFDPDHGVVKEIGIDAEIRTFCSRSGVLHGPPRSTADGAAPASIAAALTPGVSVPPELGDAAGGVTQVIVIGRVLQFSQWTTQSISGRQLVVDRVVWVDGIGQAQTTSILPSLIDPGPGGAWRPRDGLSDPTIAETGPILLDTLVDPVVLAAVDPAAASIVAVVAPAVDRIWYRRALGLDAAHDAPRWIAIDDANGVVIASGTLGFDHRPA